MLHTTRLLALLALLVACDGANDPGSFEVKFGWDQEPSEDALFIFARVVRDRTEDDPGTTVAEAPSVRRQPGARLTFDTVPNGDDYVVVIEVKASDDHNDRTRYFGESEPFALRAGENTRVDVRLALARTPSARGDADDAVTIEDAVADGQHLLVRTSAVTLRLRPLGASAVIAANDASFSLGRRQLPLADLAREGEDYLLSGWDLNAGLGCEGDVCSSGLRRVFVRFVNVQGFQSDVLNTRPIVLDGHAPTVAGASIAPSPATHGSEVLVRVEPSETLGAPPRLHVSPADPGFSAAERIGQSYVFRYVVDAAAREDLDYTFEVELQDLAGNVASGLELPGALRIDRSLPSTAGPATMDVDATSGESFAFELELSEALPGAPVVRVGGRKAECEQSPDDPMRYLCHHAPERAESDGVKTITVELIDEAGNVNTVEVGQVTYDRTPPQVVNPVITPRVAPAGGHVQLRFAFDEPARAVLVTGLDFVQLPSAEGEYIFEHVVDPDDQEGEYALHVSASDLHGNRRWSSPIGTLTIDVTPPGIRSASVSPSRVVSAQPYEVQFTTTELLSAPARLLVGSREATSCTRSGDGLAEAYRCPLVAPAANATYAADGPQALQVELVDVAGNRATVAAGMVEFDVELPVVVDATLLRVPDHAPATERNGDVITTHFSARDPITNGPVRAELSVYANKAVAADPVLSVALEGAPERTLGFVLEGREGENVRYSYTFTGDEAEGRYALDLSFRDAAGKAGAPARLPVVLQLSTTTPANGVDLGATVHRRVPWGSRASAGEPSFSLTGAVLPGSGATDVLISRQPQRASGFLVGQASVQADGTFEAPALSGGDRLELFVATVDRSGNVSDFVRTRLGEWVATLGGKRVGSDFENPHGFQAWEVMPAAVSPADGSAGAEVAGTPVARADFDDTDFSTHARSRGSYRWTAASNSALSPPPRQFQSAVYDSGRGRTVLFGGMQLSGNDLDTIWEYDGRSWEARTAAGAAPQARHLALMAYDPGHNEVILYGGVSPGSGAVNRQDMWIWNGTRWREVVPNGEWPGPRAEATMAFDVDRGRLVLFGGTHADDNTWEWDGERWEIVTRATTRPPAGIRNTMTYDATRHRTVMQHGGWTWEWDGQDWQKIEASVGGRTYYDSRHGAVRAWVTWNPATGTQGIYQWSGTDWSLVDSWDHGRDSFGMIVSYDDARGVLLGLCEVPSDPECGVLELGDGGWTNATPSPPPPPRFAAMSAYDSKRAEVLVFGGAQFDLQTYRYIPRNDLWAWNGRRWRCLAGQCIDPEPAGSPPPRSDGALAYDPVRDVVLLYGGIGVLSSQYDDTWEWSGGAWTCVAGSCATDSQPADVPGRRNQHAMEYDQARGRIVMFGGLLNGNSAVNRTDDSWEWDPEAKRWNRVGEPVRPPGRSAHTMAYDYFSGRVMSWGGYPLLDEVRAWNGADGRWDKVDTLGQAPSMRAWHAMASHQTRERIAIWAGDVDLSDLWEFDPSAGRWHPIVQPLLAPSGRFQPVLEYHGASDRLLAFGGAIGASLKVLDDTWIGDFESRPGHLVRVAAGALDTAGLAHVDELAIHAIAGGSGALGPEQRDGVALSTWDGYRWVPVSCNNGGAGTPAEVSFSSRSPYAFQRLQSGNALRFALSPVGGYGTEGPATLRTDYVEVEARYHVGDGPGAVAADPDDPGSASGVCP